MVCLYILTSRNGSTGHNIHIEAWQYRSLIERCEHDIAAGYLYYIHYNALMYYNSRSYNGLSVLYICTQHTHSTAAHQPEG